MKIEEIREQAKIGLQGNYFKCIVITVFYTVITILTSYFTDSLTTSFANLNLESLLDILIFLINLAIFPFSYGVLVSLIEIFKGKKIGYTDFINISLLNYVKIIKLFLSIILRILPYILIYTIALVLTISEFNNSLINLIGFCLFIVSIFILIIKVLDFAFALFINYDNPSLSCKEILSNSKSIIKNKKLKYLLLVLSFVLWFVVIILINKLLMYFIASETIISYINSILIAIISPLITVSQYVFYDNLTNEQK